MVAASVVDVAINPNNTAQRYHLWNNGRIDAIGGAPLITDQVTWYDRFEPPGVALYIANWTTGAGWVLDYRGGFNAINGATNTGVTNGVMSGVALSASPYTKLYTDWSWNPAGNGQGYVLDRYGRLIPFGGASALVVSGAPFASGRARKLRVQWTPTRKAYVMDMSGALWGAGGLVNRKLKSLAPDGRDVARDFEVTNFTDGSGHILDRTGRVHPYGTATEAFGWPSRYGGDVARALRVLSASSPASYLEVWSGGQQLTWVSSTPPTVTAGGDGPSPAATVTDTTRPDLTWSYSDAQNDAQTTWQVLVFTQTFVTGHSMTDPLTWTSSALVSLSGVDPSTRGITCPVDLPNGSYRMYVRVKDAANQWSTWSNWGWTQNVPAPATPTGLTATANQAAFTVALSVSATTGGSATLVRFECSDDGGTTWLPVRGADAVPLIATTTATDLDAPLGVTRSYRAVAYNTEPRVISSASNTVTAKLTTLTDVLTAVDDSTLGGAVSVQANAPFEWSRSVTAGVFQGIGAEYPTVVKDKRQKARRTTLNVLTETRAEWDRLKALADSGSTLVYRGPYGDVIYCEIVGDWTQSQLPVPLGYVHATPLPLVEVRPPQLAG